MGNFGGGRSVEITGVEAIVYIVVGQGRIRNPHLGVVGKAVARVAAHIGIGVVSIGFYLINAAPLGVDNFPVGRRKVVVFEVVVVGNEEGVVVRLQVTDPHIGTVAVAGVVQVAGKQHVAALPGNPWPETIGDVFEGVPILVEGIKRVEAVSCPAK